jgi:hypothetical protein
MLQHGYTIQVWLGSNPGPSTIKLLSSIIFYLDPGSIPGDSTNRRPCKCFDGLVHRYIKYQFGVDWF